MGVGGKSHTPAALPSAKRFGTLCAGGSVDSGLFWTGEDNLALIGIRSLDRPGRGESLYLLSYPGSLLISVYNLKSFTAPDRRWSISWGPLSFFIFIYLFVRPSWPVFVPLYFHVQINLLLRILHPFTFQSKPVTVNYPKELPVFRAGSVGPWSSFKDLRTLHDSQTS